MKEVSLKVGDVAPPFSVHDVFGNTVDLSSYDEKFVLLVFLRYSGCPWCNLALHRLSLEHSMLSKNGCEIIAFIQSDKEHIIQNIYERHKVKPPFPVVADPAKEYYRLYGVKTSTIGVVARSIGKVPYWVQAVYKHGFKQTSVDGDLFLVPALFLVNGSTCEIVKIEYGSSFYDHDTFTEIYEPLIFKQ